LYCSSGRRHTSFSRDWSSDVCSSDLAARSNARGRSRVSLKASSKKALPNQVQSLASEQPKELRSAAAAVMTSRSGARTAGMKERPEERRVEQERRKAVTRNHR